MEIVVKIVIVVLLALILFHFMRAIANETVDYFLLTPMRIKNIMDRQGIRGPKPGFLGHVWDLASLIFESTSLDMPTTNHDIVPRLLPHYIQWSQIYGKRFIYWVGMEARMCLTETDLIRELLTRHSTTSGRSWIQQQGSKHFIGRGLLMANGQDWDRQRRVVAPAFYKDKLKSYAGEIVESVKEMIQCMQTEVATGRVEFEIAEYMEELTEDIISRTGCGDSYEKGKQILRLLKLIQSHCVEASHLLILPGDIFVPKVIKSLNKEVEQLLMEMIERRIDIVKMGRCDSYGDDFLSVLLNGMKNTGGEGNGLQVIMDECKTFLVAGHETTSLLLTWTIMLLASNPSWQDDIRAEARQVFNGGSPSLEDISRLSVLNMVIKESLRLYPPATMLPRTASEDIQLGDLHIPKGLSIWIPVLAMHHNKDIWGQDANEFNPIRFATMSKSQKSHFMPFASGPRNCVGQSFALMGAKIMLAMLICKFRFTISNSYRHAPVSMITIKPKHGVQVCLELLDD